MKWLAVFILVSALIPWSSNSLVSQNIGHTLDVLGGLMAGLLLMRKP